MLIQCMVQCPWFDLSDHDPVQARQCCKCFYDAVSAVNSEVRDMRKCLCWSSV